MRTRSWKTRDRRDDNTVVNGPGIVGLARLSPRVRGQSSLIPGSARLARKRIARRSERGRTPRQRGLVGSSARCSSPYSPQAGILSATPSYKLGANPVVKNWHMAKRQCSRGAMAFAWRWRPSVTFSQSTESRGPRVRILAYKQSYRSQHQRLEAGLLGEY